MMVSEVSIFLMWVTLLISLVLPVILLIIYALKNKGKKIVSAWFMGAAGFFVLQIVLRMPILSMLSIMPGFQSFVENNYVVYVLILGFTAALFEVIGRLAVAKLMSNNLTYERGIAAGLGHGGIESIWLVGITYMNNLLYTVMINNNLFDGYVEQYEALGVDVSQLLAVKEALLTSPSYMFGLAGYERLLTIIFHTAMSLLVCYFVYNGQAVKGVLISLILHTIVDSVAGLLSGLSTSYMGNVMSQNTGYIMIYSFLTLMAVISVVVILKIKKEFKKDI